jgi:hypothetical protein
MPRIRGNVPVRSIAVDFLFVPEWSVVRGRAANQFDSRRFGSFDPKVVSRRFENLFMLSACVLPRLVCGFEFEVMPIRKIGMTVEHGITRKINARLRVVRSSPFNSR